MKGPGKIAAESINGDDTQGYKEQGMNLKETFY
jgi:hypothetical protein